MDFSAFLLSHEPALRLGAFLFVFGAMALWEAAAPRRALALSRRLRWSHNLGLVALNTIVLRLLFPAAAIGVAALAVDRGFGLLNQVAMPDWIAFPFAVIVLDFVMWLQHVAFHAVPALWRIHRMHHADPDYDLTTGTRFHPLEMVLSVGVKCVAVALLGPPVAAVVIFEVLLNAMAMFNHGNVRLPGMLDRRLRRMVVTPDMHRVHHSIANDERNSNFGFNFSFWDRLLGTYRDQPRGGHKAMTLGLAGHTDPHEVSRLPGMLALPFRRDPRARTTCMHG